MNRLKFLYKNWKMGTHLLFRTKRFGVNNRWWSDFDSPFGWSNWKKITLILILPIIHNYQGMKFRACHPVHFMSDEEKKLMGWLKTNKK